MKIALQLPGFSKDALDKPIPNLNSQFVGEQGNLANLLSPILNVAFFAALFLSFFYLIWGAFAYILAQGKKEDLAKARARLSWAIIGLMIVLLSYAIAKFASEIFTPGKGGLPF